MRKGWNDERTSIIYAYNVSGSHSGTTGSFLDEVDLIPSKIDKLALLDALDLSNNQLSGAIPSSLTEVARLDVLDLSNNNLSGKIPTGTQLQSFEASSYTGNPELCGAPLLKMFPGYEPTASTAPAARNEEEDQDKFITTGFYVTLGLGFVVLDLCAKLSGAHCAGVTVLL
ncbi:hypothetical protein TIFTF001_038756 [Ficus carica]|uniref:Uncharacterized protein n=1 Tax=Ficus carica TaxID=3494 RepID=A0AA88JD90_FICCA|nr:hypothetical protein TIFTF001_038754 [Ficus carica]GMN69710.1 hypothetical protein TIFTF001_038756 [Ficus carica]